MRAATACHQSVVVDPVEKLRQVDIDNELMAFGDIGLRLRHRLVGRAPRPEAVAVLAERRVPQRLEPLQHRLLNHAVNHGWNAEVARPAGRLRDLHPTHRLRLVAPLAAVDLRSPASALSGRPAVGGRSSRPRPGAPCCAPPHATPLLCSPGHRSPPSDRLVAAGLSGSDIAVTTSTSRTVRARGFTPARYRQVQRELAWRSLCGHETSELLALSFNPFSGTVRAFSRRGGLLRPLLTSAPRSGGLAAPSVPKDTAQISWGKSRSLPRTPAGFTALALDGYGLRDFLPARPTNAASYPVAVRRVAISLHASFRRSLAVPPLRFTRASPPSGCTGDFHPQAAGHAQHTGSPCGPPPKAARSVLDGREHGGRLMASGTTAAA